MKVANIGGAKAATVQYHDQEYYFLFNGTAMFALQDEYGSEYTKLLSADTQEGQEALLNVSYLLAEQGELARRDIRLSEHEMPTREDWGSPVRLQPADLLILRRGCMDAFSLGYRQDLKNDDEEIDLGMMELQKKRKSPKPSMKP